MTYQHPHPGAESGTQSNVTAPREPFVVEQEAAEFLKVSVRTLQRWRTEPPAGGAPRFYKLGRKRVAYRLSDLSAWAESRAFGSTSEFDAE